ncbi:MAG: tyrosine-protein phosphatase [Kiritimatiellae bacterium]|nr:tyrosine-protein phosphatase [Kiritimatiellia bacterium]
MKRIVLSLALVFGVLAQGAEIRLDTAKSENARTHLSWTYLRGKKGDKDRGKKNPKFVVTVMKAADGAVTQIHLLSSNTLDVVNLEVGTDYNWRVAISGDRGREEYATSGSFTTLADLPRVLDWGAAGEDVRDLGGGVGPDGKRIRQGLVYSAKSFGNGSLEARRQAQLCCGVRTFLALRETDAAAALRACFTALTDPAQYPICLRAREDLLPVVQGLLSPTASADAEKQVLAAGFTVADIAKFRAIMVGTTSTRSACDLYTAFNTGTVAERRQMMVDGNVRTNMHALGTPPKGAPENGVPRWVPGYGVRNLRDLGGWTGLGGKKVRTGRIYRSACLETVKDKEAFLKAYGIKTDLDLRTPEYYEKLKGISPLGESVKLVNRSAPNYGSCGHAKGMKYFAEVFRLFLDEANYPILFHCAKGADRTGSLAFQLNGLLGVDEDDLAKDWQMTAFFNINPLFRDPERYDALVGILAPYAGDTWTAKFEAYAKACGITAEEITRFRQLMLAD